MKSKILSIAMLIAAAACMFSCDDDSTMDMTRITYYANLELEGESVLYVDKGSTFVDPGYKATMNGEDVTTEVEVTSNLDTGTSGVYTINYSIVNNDGFYSTASRKIIVLDPNDAVEGLYETDPNSYRLYSGARVPYNGAFEVLILNNGDGTYFVDDLLGGWYCQRAGYGTSYAMQGNISIDADGNITLINSLVPGWGDSATGITNGKFDNGTISWDLEYTDYPFNFVLTMYKK